MFFVFCQAGRTSQSPVNSNANQNLDEAKDWEHEDEDEDEVVIPGIRRGRQHLQVDKLVRKHWERLMPVHDIRM